MSKTWLIIRHEFLNLVKRRGFIVMTLAFPAVGFAAIGIYLLVSGLGAGAPAEVPRVGYVDELGGFEGFASQGNITFQPYATEELARAALQADEIDEYFVIPPDYVASGHIFRFVTRKELEPPEEVYRAMRAFLQNNLLRGKAPPEITERVAEPLFLTTTRLDPETGEVAPDQGGFASFLAPMVFAFLLITSIGSSSGYLLQGLGEEKENRIMEVLLSSVSPRQLLTGKVLGLGAAGLLQVVIWMGAVAVLARLASGVIGGVLAAVRVPDNMMALGIAYYILGYLLFAVIQAGIGAIGSSAKESQQMVVLLVLPAVLPFYIFLLFLREHPDHVLNTILTLIPVTAPMSVFIRMGLSEIPAWELVTSMLLLALSIVGGVFVAARAFRVFTLMYGKTPGLREIFRQLRQS